jgi:hypothetical protein
MDTFSTVSGDAEYVAGIDFTAVQARYVCVSALPAPQTQETI